MSVGETFIDWIDLKQDHQKTFHFARAGSAPVAKLADAYANADAAYLAALARQSTFEPCDIYHGGIYARGVEFAETREGNNVYYLLGGDSQDPKNVGLGFKRGFHEGSHSTKVGLKSDGRIVHMSGNVGRCDRTNNLWNYDLADTLYLANRIIRNKQERLFEFTRGDQYLRDSISETDKRKGVSPWFWSGAVCNEIHVTRNYYAGGDGLAIESMRDMRGRRMARVAKAAYGDETINFGMPTRKGQRLHKAVVVYRKGPEMLAHAKGEDQKRIIKASEEYKLAMDLGIIRIECKFGAHYLRENNQRYLGDLDMGKLIALYDRETAALLLARADSTARLIEDMPQKLKMTALSWIDGRDPRAYMCKTTFKTHRKALLGYGLDISEPRCVNGRPNAEDALQRLLDALPQHSLQPMTAPDWYGLPEVDRRAA